MTAEVSRPPGLAAAGMVQIAAGFGAAGQAAAGLDGASRKMRLAQEMFQIPMAGLVPITTGSGSLVMPDSGGPPSGFYWSVRRLSAQGFSAGTVTAYKNGVTQAPGGPVVGNAEVVAVFNPGAVVAGSAAPVFATATGAANSTTTLTIPSAGAGLSDTITNLNYVFSSASLNNATLTVQSGAAVLYETVIPTGATTGSVPTPLTGLPGQTIVITITAIGAALTSTINAIYTQQLASTSSLIPAQNFGRGDLLLNPNDFLTFAATGITVTAAYAGVQVNGSADCFPSWLLPEYLM